jgi:hypothetical protein
MRLTQRGIREVGPEGDRATIPRETAPITRAGRFAEEQRRQVVERDGVGEDRDPGYHEADEAHVVIEREPRDAGVDAPSCECQSCP